MAKVWHFENLMQGRAFRWGLNIVLAIVIFYNAQIGQLLGIKGPVLPISLFWPATGFSLAALLLFGKDAWPGIFLGKLVYNVWHLVDFQHPQLLTIVACIILTAGSVIQALVANYIMRRYTSINYFATGRDMLIFLLPAGFLSCIIGATIGTATLYALRPFSFSDGVVTWVTFILGDSMGIYAFTPLIVVWSENPFPEALKKRWLEVVYMTLVFIAISVLAFMVDRPFLYLYMPFSLWVAYRFRMHGISLAVFFIVISTVIAATMGYGRLMLVLPEERLYVLLIFLEIIIWTSYILSGVLNEREAMLYLIENQNIDIRQQAESRMEELREIQGVVFIKKQLLDSLALMTSGIINHIQEPLKRITSFTKASQLCLHRIQGLLNFEKEKDGKLGLIESNFKVLEGYLNHLVDFEVLANKLAKVIQDQSIFATPGKIEVEAVNINSVIITSLNQCMYEFVKKNPKFKCKIVRQFDKNVKALFAIPEGLSVVFKHIFNNALLSMKQKRDQLGAAFVSILDIRTVDYYDKVEIVIRDNGLGMSEDKLKHFFRSFIQSSIPSSDPNPKLTEEIEEMRFAGVGLSFVHDIIVHVHHGEINVKSKVGEFLQLTLTLPKNYRASIIHSLKSTS